MIFSESAECRNRSERNFLEKVDSLIYYHVILSSQSSSSSDADISHSSVIEGRLAFI